MSRPVQLRMTTAKAAVAGIGATITAVAVFVPVLLEALADESISAGEVAGLVVPLMTLAATVYAVWKVPNRPKTGL